MCQRKKLTVLLFIKYYLHFVIFIHTHKHRMIRVIYTDTNIEQLSVDLALICKLMFGEAKGLA